MKPYPYKTIVSYLSSNLMVKVASTRTASMQYSGLHRNDRQLTEQVPSCRTSRWYRLHTCLEHWCSTAERKLYSSECKESSHSPWTTNGRRECSSIERDLDRILRLCCCFYFSLEANFECTETHSATRQSILIAREAARRSWSTVGKRSKENTRSAAINGVATKWL